MSRTVTKGLLAHLGFDVATANSADECLRVVNQEHKVVIIDVSMAGIDGYELANQIHEKFSKRHERPFIVGLIGTTDRVMKEKCLRAGMDGVIVKPISVEKMRNVLTELFDHGVVLEMQ